MKVKIALCCASALLVTQGLFAQKTSDLDPLFETGDRYTREANIKYAKRIHRIIDTRQKQNKVLEWPNSALRDLVWHSVFTGVDEFEKIDVYTDESLQTKADTTAIRDMVEVEMVTQVIDRLLGGLKDTMITLPFEPEKINKYRIMEDWLFDANYGDFRPRIIAIAPLYPIPTQSGIDLGEIPIYWIKMDDFGPILSGFRVFNPHNDASRLSFDQFFNMRHFSSYIVKENNVFDADIAYLEEFRDDGIAALLESDRIKNDLFILEHDLWEY